MHRLAIPQSRKRIYIAGFRSKVAHDKFRAKLTNAPARSGRAAHQMYSHLCDAMRCRKVLLLQPSVGAYSWVWQPPLGPPLSKISRCEDEAMVIRSGCANPLQTHKFWRNGTASVIPLDSSEPARYTPPLHSAQAECGEFAAL
jgi:hypothetical protein